MSSQPHDLFTLIRKRDFEKFKQAIAAGANLHALTKNGMTPLHRAAEFGLVNFVEALLEAGSKIDTLDEKNRTPLYVAATGKTPEHTKVFITLVTQGASLSGEASHTLIRAAASAGNTETMRYLRSQGISLRTTDRIPLLHCAINSGNIDGVKFLLERGCSTRETDQRHRTSVHIAAGCGNLAILQMVVEATEPHYLDLENKQRKTPLFSAVEKGWREGIDLLIAYGGRPECFGNNGLTPLHWSAAQGMTASVEALLKGGANPNVINLPSSQYLTGLTPLHLLITGTRTAQGRERDYVECARLLLEGGADPEIKSRHPSIDTPLQSAENQCYWLYEAMKSVIERRELQQSADRILSPELPEEIEMSGLTL